MTAADRLTKLTSQLIGDIGQLPGVQLDSAGEAQLVQLLTDAFETVGHLALEEWEAVNKPAITADPATRQVTAHPGDVIT